MPNDLVRTFWDSVLAQVQDSATMKDELGSHLKLEKIPNGFRVWRNFPFLAVERWLVDNQIHGRSEAKDKVGREMLIMFPPLTITGENEARLPPDPLRKPGSLTATDVVNSVVDLFSKAIQP